MLTSRSRGPLPVPFLLALAGMAFAFWNAWGAPEDLCFSAGCKLYGTFAVNGVSLWWGGAAAFAGRDCRTGIIKGIIKIVLIIPQ